MHRSVIIKSYIEPKLAMIKQMEEGLALCNLLEAVKSHPAIFKPVFVEDDTFAVTPEKLLDGFQVVYSERQLEKKSETVTYKHFCDFVEELGYVGKNKFYCITFLHGLSTEFHSTFC